MFLLRSQTAAKTSLPGEATFSQIQSLNSQLFEKHAKNGCFGDGIALANLQECSQIMYPISQYVIFSLSTHFQYAYLNMTMQELRTSQPKDFLQPFCLLVMFCSNLTALSIVCDIVLDDDTSYVLCRALMIVQNVRSVIIENDVTNYGKGGNI